MNVEEELRNLIMVWISALISICYCYYIPSKISKGFLRLLSLLPICIQFLLLPLFLSSVHLCGMTGLFLSWLANFKLILFAFDQGPLCPLTSNLLRFICFACFPIQTKQNPNSPRVIKINESWVLLSIKVLVFVVVLHAHEYINALNLPELGVMAFYCLHSYLEVELFLVLLGFLLSTLLRCDIDPMFNEPYLTTSLQDFWSRRWNLMVSAVLRSAVHIPVQRFAKRFFLDRDKSRVAGVLATFLVSGLMHELIYFYYTHIPPTWEVTCFFLLHGVATSIEMAVKKKEWCKPPNRVVSCLMALSCLSTTALWLFIPQLLRNNVHERAISESLMFVDLANLFYVILSDEQLVLTLLGKYITNS